ncbi:MAG: hypothetical protein H0Z39_04215 [Peptococcaceae bacterium]|nr:hypothetical protein [Peptococcaceae bacterium]
MIDDVKAILDKLRNNLDHFGTEDIAYAFAIALAAAAAGSNCQCINCNQNGTSNTAKLGTKILNG